MKKRRCNHCQLNYDENILIKEHSNDEELYFCCKGCQGIYHLLKDEGLDSFYEKLGSSQMLSPPKESSNFDKFDLESFQKRYIKKSDDGFNEVDLIIEGIHCSACVWLNEKILHQQDGIVEASVNGASHKAKVLWDPEIISFSKIIQIINSIGYNAYPYDVSEKNVREKAVKKEYYSKLLVGVFATLNIMWLAVAKYAGYFTGMKLDVKLIISFAEFALATPTLFYTGIIFYKGAYFGVKNRIINMDFLIATGASLTYAYSLYAMLSGNGETYFDSVTMIITFVFAGKYLEILTKKKASDRLDFLGSSMPTEVRVLKGDSLEFVHVLEVKVGDIVELLAGDRAVIDGVIVKGSGSFDNSSLTGESELVFLNENMEVLSGSLCVDGVIRYRVSRPYKESLLSKIISTIEDSMSKKPRIEELANQISGYFSIAILFISFLTFCFWYFKLGSFEEALIISIAVIVVACPCALGLATPVSTLVGIGVGAKNGILFKKATYLELMAKSKTIILDKTGTITVGKPKVVSCEIAPMCDIGLLTALLESSNHPVSKGVLDYLKESNLFVKPKDISAIKEIKARGIEAKHNDIEIFGGNATFLNEHGIESLSPLGTHYQMAQNGVLVATFILKDKPKKDAKKVIKALKKEGFRIIMATGDNKEAAIKIAKEVGIDEVHHSLLPQDKAQLIKKYHPVIMVGDGINDSLALLKSDVAIAMGEGADTALNSSDVVLLESSLSSLLKAVLLSKRVYKTIKQNIGFSLIYNLFTIPLAVLGFIIPLFAALLMSLSSIIVTLNALRIKLDRRDYE